MQPPSLICESCAYPILSLLHRPDSRCPECGTPVAHSLPAARPGTPWQRASTLRALPLAWLTTNFHSLIHPRQTFKRLSIRPGVGLLWANILFAAAFLIDPWVGVLIADPARGWQTRGPLGLAQYAAVWCAELLIGSLFLFLLTWVEVVGIRFFAARRRWPLHRDAAWQIAAHASVGWIVMAWLQLIALALSTALVYWFQYAPSGKIDFRPVLPASIDSTFLLGAGLALAALLCGLLVFECLVYVGVRACRFANHALTPLPTPTDPPPARILPDHAPAPSA